MNVGSMDDYYSPHPNVLLDAPVVVVGFLGSKPAAVAHHVAALTGMGLVITEQSVEHNEARSASDVLRDRGREVYHAQETAVLARALRATPPQVVGVTAGLPLPSDALEAVARCKVVRLDQPLEDAWRRFSGSLGGRYFFHRVRVFGRDADNLDNFKIAQERWAAQFSNPWYAVDVESRFRPGRLARQIVERLEQANP